MMDIDREGREGEGGRDRQGGRRRNCSIQPSLRKLKHFEMLTHIFP